MLSVNKWFEMIEKNIEPTWKRLGFSSAPDPTTSGKGVGIIILDEVIPNKFISHLGKRLQQVKVNDDFKVICKEVAKSEARTVGGAGEHGLMTLQLLTHLPLNVNDHLHVGISPAANFIIISEVDPVKIEIALKWVLQKRNEWNIRLLLNTLVPSTHEIGAIRPTSNDPYVQALYPAIESGILIVAANGNTKAHNNLHPIQFFTVGGYDDEGMTNNKKHKEHPAVPWGKNGDGHVRPDILAPFTYLPVPFCEVKKSKQLLSYFGGSCGSAALVTGVCAHLMSKFPQITNEQLIHFLISNGDYLPNSNIPVPKICVDKGIRAILLEEAETKPRDSFSRIKYTAKTSLLTSEDPVERALMITELIDRGEIDRGRLWELLHDKSPHVRKTIISYGLGPPKNKIERELYWKNFYNSGKRYGENISWLYQLLWNANTCELDRWVELLKENDVEINLCVKLYLEKNFPDSPKIKHYPITNLDFMSISTQQILDWYSKKQLDTTKVHHD